MNADPKRGIDVFTEALQLPTEERIAFLDRACAGDENLRHSVEALLRSNDRVGQFLETPPTPCISERRAKVASAEKPGDQIDRYKLLQEIGEGGCGVVFMAEQDEPVRRRVALKVVKPGMDTKNVIARFEAERQALALMDHPNIAKIFDAGATESGRPYFVMELVRGSKITEFCDRHSLPINERLKLFVQVCHAVQHAHQKGVIHRDIKPSNILVTVTKEDEPLPVVIDFGISKAMTNQKLTDKTIHTAFGALIGTPAYISPEQAALTTVDVDTRADIYSLGVVLYELLTGSTPFDAAELLKTGLDECRRVIREQEPARPSARLSKMTDADLRAVAEHRKSEPAKLVGAICGDLDWIVMKALEKDRARRYVTVNGLAFDIQRYLAGEAVLARPPSALYKFQKLVSRNKLLFGGIGAAGLLLVLGLLFVSLALAKARRESNKSGLVTQFLEAMLRGVGPSVARGRDTTMLKDILDQTADQVGKELKDQPAVEAELLNLIGTIYQQIGNYDRAGEMHREALAIRQKIFGAGSAEAAASLNDLGVDLMALGKLGEAKAAVGEALAIRRRLFAGESTNTATSLNDLGAVYRESGMLTNAEAMARQALQIRQKLLGNENLPVADSLRNLSIILGDEEKWADAEAMARETLAMRRKLLELEHPWVASSLDDVAWAASSEGKWDQAETLNMTAMLMKRKLLGDQHPDVAKSLVLLGSRMREEGNLTEADAMVEASLSIQRKLLGEDHPETLRTLAGLALTLRGENKLGQAEVAYREALASWQKRAGNEDHETLETLMGLAGVLIDQGKFADAQQLLDEALTPAFVKQPASVALLNMRANLKGRNARWQEAAIDAALACVHRPEDHFIYHMEAVLLAKTDNRPAYEQFCHELIANFTNTMNPYVAERITKDCLLLPHSGVDLEAVDKLADSAVLHGSGDAGGLPWFQTAKALSQYRKGLFAQAAEWAKKPLKNSNVPLFAEAHAYAILAMADWELGQKEEARAALAKGNSLEPNLLPSDSVDMGESWLAWLEARVSLDEAEAMIQPISAVQGKSNKP